MLGVFDSGLGGLTVLRRLRSLLPNEDLVYFADQLHVPYGDRSTTDLRGLLASNVAYLRDLEADAIVMGCNTSCAIAARYGWPAAGIPIFDLIDAAADAVVAAGARRVGIVATAATVRLGAYGDRIRARDERIAVQETPAPALVPLVEAGAVSGPTARAAVADACRPLERPDAVVLACTHYPLLDAEFAAVLGKTVLRIDPAQEQALRAAAWARARGERGSGTTRYITSGPLAAFRASLERLEDRLGSGDLVERKAEAIAAT